MLNLYGATNYEVEKPLTMDYDRITALAQKSAGGYPAQYKYTRHATKVYKFKGMSEAALNACLLAKKIQYTRKFMEWKYYAVFYRCPVELHYSAQAYLEPPPYTAQVASFTVSRGDAPVFDLQISINETVSLYDTKEYDPSTLSGVTNIEKLFAEQTYYYGPNPIFPDWYTTLYYKSYVHTYSYDDNLSGDVIVS